MSLVVPASFVTIDTCFFDKKFINELLPTFGFPIKVTTKPDLIRDP